ncbi:hypothetical protein ABZ760_08155 [Streptomyces sp. NPDC006658]|uniref:hypothetical protein n=1 Tax=Streptomyces sp. NPDC006658 TaxID=3156900 RepID=UPI0033ED7C1E
MGMKAKLATGAVVGLAVIGAVSATAGSDKDGGSDGGAKAGSSASAGREPGDGGTDAGGSKDSGATETAGAAGTAEEKKAAFGGDGEYQVGTDIKPGTYRTANNTDGTCYWERAKDASGELDSTLANDNVSGRSYVTVKATDKLFKSNGCSDWEAVDPKAKGTPAGSMDGDGGMFKVGTDIAPGTYKSTGNADGSCYWERTKDAGQGLDSIIANNNVTGTAVVTISASDGYFKTTGCGDWKKA